MNEIEFKRRTKDIALRVIRAAEAGLVSEARLRKLIADIDEIAAMVVASIRTLRRRKR
jgi:hypothetical protein